MQEIKKTIFLDPNRFVFSPFGGVQVKDIEGTQELFGFEEIVILKKISSKPKEIKTHILFALSGRLNLALNQKVLFIPSLENKLYISDLPNNPSNTLLFVPQIILDTLLPLKLEYSPYDLGSMGIIQSCFKDSSVFNSFAIRSRLKFKSLFEKHLVNSGKVKKMRWVLEKGDSLWEFSLKENIKIHQLFPTKKMLLKANLEDRKLLMKGFTKVFAIENEVSTLDLNQRFINVRGEDQALFRSIGNLLYSRGSTYFSIKKMKGVAFTCPISKQSFKTWEEIVEYFDEFSNYKLLPNWARPNQGSESLSEMIEFEVIKGNTLYYDGVMLEL